MYRHIKIFLCFSLLLMRSGSSFSQDRLLDSLKLALKTVKHDTSRVWILCSLAEKAGDDEWPAFNEQALVLSETILKKLKPSDPFYFRCKQNLANSIHNKAWLMRTQGNTKTALELHHKGIKVQEEIGDKKGMAQGYNLIGAIHLNMGENEKALELYTKSLKLSEEVDYKKGIAESLLDISTVYQLQGNIPKALEYYARSLKMMEALDNKRGMAHCLNNLGLIYFNQDDVAKALENYTKSLALYESIQDNNGMATLYNNLATIFKKQGDTERAIEFFGKSLKQYEKIPEPKGIAMALNNLGSMYTSENKNREALDHHIRSLKLFTEIKDKMGMANALYFISGVYIKQNEHQKALGLASKSMLLSKELGYPKLIGNAADNLSRIYTGTGDHKAALENYELYIKMQDSISNEASRKASLRSQLKYEYEKKAAADSITHIKEIEIRNIELQEQSVELTAQRNKQFALYGGLSLVLIFAGIMYNRFKVTDKQKIIIEEKEKETQKQNSIILMQKYLVEEKQKEILDSINYAKRIQQAHMPTNKYIEKNLERLKK